MTVFKGELTGPKNAAKKYGVWILAFDWTVGLKREQFITCEPRSGMPVMISIEPAPEPAAAAGAGAPAVPNPFFAGAVAAETIGAAAAGSQRGFRSGVQ